MNNDKPSEIKIEINTMAYTGDQSSMRKFSELIAGELNNRGYRIAGGRA
jgi:hypothetical protein